MDQMGIIQTNETQPEKGARQQRMNNGGRGASSNQAANDRMNVETAEPGTKDYMLTPEDLRPDDILGSWNFDKAVNKAEEFIQRFGQPRCVEEASLTWMDVVDDVSGTHWDQLQIRDMAIPHKNHYDTIIGYKYVEMSEREKEAVHLVEGVMGTPVDTVAITCCSIDGLNVILDWVYKQIKLAGPKPQRRM
jgi:hypothetical protein